jgi:hypothetical protein
MAKNSWENADDPISKALGDFARRAADNPVSRFVRKGALGQMLSGAKAGSPAQGKSRFAGTTSDETPSQYVPEKGKMGTEYKAPKLTPAPKPAAAKSSYKAKGPADYNKDVGAFYLQATKDMFSKGAGGAKGTKNR